MLYRLVRPVKRPGSSIPQFVKRIPADVLPLARGRSFHFSIASGVTKLVRVSASADMVRFSLGTHDPAEAKARLGRATAVFEEICKALRAKAPVNLTYAQATALGGQLYRAWAEGEGRERTTVVQLTPSGFVSVTPSLEDERTTFEGALRLLEAALPEAASDDGNEEPKDRLLEARIASLVGTLDKIADRLLLEEGIASVTPESRPLIHDAFRLALNDALQARQRNAEGDYSPDPKANRFPVFKQLQATKELPSSAAKLSLTGLLEGWWNEAEKAGRKRSTHESYRNTVANLRAFLKHDDALQITPDDIVRFKDHRLGTVAAKTVKDSDLAGLKTIFGWAVSNRKLSSNPAQGITIKVGKARKLRSKGLSDAEAKALLGAASAYKAGPSELPQTAAAKRWIPWLLAYTGARVGEMAQLRKQDVRREGDIWVLRITPEAGTVKTDEAREVVLHAHLLELGFAAFVTGAQPGYLFLKAGKSGDITGLRRALKNRLAQFARDVVKDPNVAPNHGWRHRFKTLGIEAGIDHRILDAIQGQSARTVAESYGDVTLKAMANAMSKFPKQGC